MVDPAAPSEVRLRRALARILVSANLTGRYRETIVDWLPIDDFTLRVLGYVGPQLTTPGLPGSVASRVILAALEAHQDARETSQEAARRAYVTTLVLRLVCELRQWRVSVHECADTWRVWHYERPLRELQQSRPPGTVMVRRRTHPIDEEKLAVVLVGQLLRLHDLDAIAFEAGAFLAMVKQKCANTDCSGWS